MEVLLRGADGLRTDAVLLAAGRDRMRFALRNGNDAIELRREGEQWISEDGSAFEFDAWIADSCRGFETLPGGLLRWTLAAWPREHAWRRGRFGRPPRESIS
jgi:hypothetical protein